MFYMLLLITVFTLISFTFSNAVVVKSIRILFPFSSFSSSTSWYHLLTFFLNAASSLIVNLAVPVTILVLSYLSFSMFRLTSFLFKSSLIMCCLFFKYYYLFILAITAFSCCFTLLDDYYCFLLPLYASFFLSFFFPSWLIAYSFSSYLFHATSLICLTA